MSAIGTTFGTIKGTAVMLFHAKPMLAQCGQIMDGLVCATLITTGMLTERFASMWPHVLPIQPLNSLTICGSASVIGIIFGMKKGTAVILFHAKLMPVPFGPRMGGLALVIPTTT